MKFSGLLAFLLSWPVAWFIRYSQRRLMPAAKPLDATAILEMKGYFPSGDLTGVAVIIQDPLPIGNPPFASVARWLGYEFPSMEHVRAITLDQSIAARENMTPSLLFHEMVHVVQYRLLGVTEFARLYVRGFLRAGSYVEIPLERCAYDLEFRFEVEGVPFDVEREVQAWIDAGRY